MKVQRSFLIFWKKFLDFVYKQGPRRYNNIKGSTFNGINIDIIFLMRYNVIRNFYVRYFL